MGKTHPTIQHHTREDLNPLENVYFKSISKEWMSSKIYYFFVTKIYFYIYAGTGHTELQAGRPWV